MVKPFEFSTPPDLGLAIELAEAVGGEHTLQQMAVIEGARYAIESYQTMTAAGMPVTFSEATERAKADIVAEGLHVDKHKCTDEFFLGIGIGILLARRADHRSQVVNDEL